MWLMTSEEGKKLNIRGLRIDHTQAVKTSKSLQSQEGQMAHNQD